MSRLPPQLAHDLEAVRRAGAVIAGIASEPPKREEEMRAALTRELDTQLAEVQRQIDAHRALTGHGANDPHIAGLEQQSSRLLALRQNAESAPSLTALSQLRGQVSDAVRGAGEAVQAASIAVSAGGSGGVGSGSLASQRIADATYRAQVAQYSREMAPIMQRVDQHRRADDELGRRYGVDTRPFARVDDELKHKADEARKRGDQPEGIRHDALRGLNSLHRAKTLLDAMPDGPDKEKRKAEYERQLEDQRKAEELRRKTDAAEIENVAKKRDRTDPFASPDERKKWVDQEIQKREEQHRQRQDDMARKAGVSPEVRRAVQSDFRRHLDANPQAPTVAPAASPEPAAQPAGDAVKAIKQGFSETPAPAYDGKPPADLPGTARDAAKKAAEPAAKSGTKPAGEGDRSGNQTPNSSPDKKPEARQQGKH